MPPCAVGFGWVAGEQFHVGVLYREADHGIYLLHLGWHYDPMKTGPKPQYLWIVPALDNAQYSVVAARTREIARRYASKGLPYAINYKTEFLDDYSLSNEAPGHGFTCATFVLALFKLCGIELIDRESWKTHADDDQWQQTVIAAMRELVGSGRATNEDIMAQLADKGCFRYRPQEVAASCLFDFPAAFEAVQPIAAELTGMAQGAGSIR